MSKKRQSGKRWRLISASGAGTRSEVESLPPDQQHAQISVEKRSKGKVVTVVAGLVLSPVDVKALAKSLKVACGTGGTARPDAVELQGDCRDRARSWLAAHGWGLR